MTSSMPLLRPFGTTPNDPPWFRTAMTWDQAAIFNWLERCSTGQAGGPVTHDPATQETLKRILFELKSLCHTQGVNYQNPVYPTPRPQCHIYRELNPSYNRNRPNTSLRFNLLAFPGSYEYAGRTRIVPFFNPHDLLGLFLGLLGPAPPTAVQYNYFLPLCAVYVRWCSRIAGDGDGAPQPAGMGNWPFMYQCSWRPISKADTRKLFFLGASIGGDNFSKAGRGDQWREALQRRRFDTVLRTAEYSVYRIGDFPNVEDVVPGATNQPGNCAEAYPMAHILQSDRRSNANYSGLALRRDVPMRRGWPNFYDERHYRNRLSAPCLTCGHALGLAGCVEANFLDGVPPPRQRPQPGPPPHAQL